MYLEGKKAVSWPGLQELLFPSETDMHLVRHQRYKRPEMKQQSVWCLATNYHCLYSSGVKPQGIRDTILTQKTPYPFTLHPHPQWTWKELGTLRKTPFEIIVTYDSAPGNNVWIGLTGKGNTPLAHLHLIWAPKFCISIVFNFSWDGCNTQEKWKTKVMQNLGGQIKCIMGDVQVAYKFRLGKQQLRPCITLFCTFFCCRCTTTTWKCLISRFVVDVNTRQQLSFSFLELWNSLLKFNYKKICQHLTN